MSTNPCDDLGGQEDLSAEEEGNGIDSDMESSLPPVDMSDILGSLGAGAGLNTPGTDLIPGNTYRILTVAGSDFESVGASSNAAGTVFVATARNAGGSGTAQDITDAEMGAGTTGAGTDGTGIMPIAGGFGSGAGLGARISNILDKQSNGESITDMLEGLSLDDLRNMNPGVGRAESRDNLVNRQNDRFYPGTEIGFHDDSFLGTPYGTDNNSFQKQTWIFNDACLVGATRNADDILSYEATNPRNGAKFSVNMFKSPSSGYNDRQLPRAYSYQPRSIPPHIAKMYIEGPENYRGQIVDPIRYLSDSLWINPYHLYGPYGFRKHLTEIVDNSGAISKAIRKHRDIQSSAHPAMPDAATKNFGVYFINNDNRVKYEGIEHTFSLPFGNEGSYFQLTGRTYRQGFATFFRGQNKNRGQGLTDRQAWFSLLTDNWTTYTGENPISSNSRLGIADRMLETGGDQFGTFDVATGRARMGTSTLDSLRVGFTSDRFSERINDSNNLFSLQDVSRTTTGYSDLTGFGGLSNDDLSFLTGLEIPEGANVADVKFNALDLLHPRFWRNMEDIQSHYNDMNKINSQIKYELYNLNLITSEEEEAAGFNWENYIYGKVGVNEYFVMQQKAAGLNPGNLNPDRFGLQNEAYNAKQTFNDNLLPPYNRRGTMNEEVRISYANDEIIDSHDEPYDDLYWKYAPDRFTNLNMFPVFPFWGSKLTLTDSGIPTIVNNPPVPGEEYFATRPKTVGKFVFEDYCTVIPDFFEDHEVENIKFGSPHRSKIEANNDLAKISIRPVYNYYDCLYERYFAHPVHGLPEAELPSPYLQDVVSMIENMTKEGNAIANTQSYQGMLLFRLFRLRAIKNMDQQLIGNPDEIQAYNNATQFSDFVDTSNEAQALFYEDVLQLQETADSVRAMAYKMKDAYGFNLRGDRGTAGVTLQMVNFKRNFFLSSVPREKLDEAYEKRFMNQMFVEIELDNLGKSQIAEALTFNNDNTLIQRLFTALIPTDDAEMDFYRLGKTKYSYIRQNLASHGVYGSDDSLSLKNERTNSNNIPVLSPEEAAQLGGETNSYNAIDFSDWYKRLMDELSVSEMYPIEKFSSIIRLLTIKARINTIVNGSARSWQDMMEGVKAKSEIIGYLIKKSLVNSDNSLTHLANFWVMANNDRDVEKYVDTQIKYGNVYQYDIHRIVAIVGNKYSYADALGVWGLRKRGGYEPNLDRGPSGEKLVDFPFGIVNLPCLKIMSIPGSVRRVAVVDKPPIYPNVDIIPYKNESTKILFNLSANAGLLRSKPNLLEVDDLSQFYVCALNQGLHKVFKDKPAFSRVGLQLTLGDGPIALKTQYGSEIQDDPYYMLSNGIFEFKSDDPATKFEIFRTDVYPTKIEDFRGNLLTKLRGSADNMSFVDNIVPNKKYYYTFRTEDVHGHVSNATHVYEVELVTINDAVRPSIKIIEPSDMERKKKEQQNSTMKLRQFISLRPSMRQKRIKMPQDGKFSTFRNQISDGQALLWNASNNGGIGISTSPDNQIDSVWGKKFKMRVRSKDTGKEVDINFTFKLKIRDPELSYDTDTVC